MPKRSIQAARRLRAIETSAEEMLWNALRDRRLDGWKFRRQFPIAGFVADFGCVAARLTIEVDGKHHADQLESDRAREKAIAAAGYLEIRFTNEEVRERLAWVLQEIRRTLDTARCTAIREPFPRLDPL
jgi:very-short-patch-repair endonuclease